MTAIVMNGKSRVAYNIVSSLGRKGIKVISSDFVPRSMSFTSRYSKGHFLYPSPFEQNSQKFVECILDNIARFKADVLVPVHEETFLIAKHKQEISKYVGLAVPEYDQILIAHNKDRWERVARELDIHTPETFDLAKIRKHGHLCEKLPYPLFIKPKQGGGGWGMALVGSPKELKELLAPETHCNRTWDRFFLQRKIEGATHCVAMLFNKGSLRARVAYEQLREYPLSSGQATLRISIDTPRAEADLRKLLERLEWHGICQADFVVDKESGIPYLVDLNPRFWGSLTQGIASGVDFPYLYYKIALHGDVAPVEGYKTGVMTRWIGGDVRAFFPLLKRTDRKFEFIKNFFFPGNSRILKDDFSLDDPLPFLTWYVDTFSRVLKSRSVKPSSHDSLEGVWE